MPIKLVELLPLGEAYNNPDTNDPMKSLELYLDYAFNGMEKEQQYTFDIHPKTDLSYEITINNKIKMEATLLLWANKKIKGWKFSHGKLFGNIEYSSIHGYQGDFRDVTSYIKDELEGRNTTTPTDDGSKIQLSVDELTKYIVAIKKIIDMHDWYYELTDAHNTYVRGSKKITSIKELYKKLPKNGREEIFNYWNSKSPSMFKYNDFESFNKHFGS